VKYEDPKTGNKLIKNVYLTNAINLHRAESFEYQCDVYSKNWERPGPLKHGLLAVTYDQLKDRADDIMLACAASRAVMVGHKATDDIGKLFKMMFEDAKRDAKKHRYNQKGIFAMLETVFFFVREHEMPDFLAKQNLEAGKILKKEHRSNIQQLLAHLEVWAGIPADKAILHIPEEFADIDEAVELMHNGLIE
jgi:hypothetical protein